jgi:hypothetical protein
MNRIETKEESCKSANQGCPGDSRKNQSGRCVTNRHLGSPGCPEKRSITLPLGRLRLAADGENERNR